LSGFRGQRIFGHWIVDKFLPVGELDDADTDKQNL